MQYCAGYCSLEKGKIGQERSMNGCPQWIFSANLVYGKLQGCCDLNAAKLGPYRCGVNVAGSTRLQYM